MIHFMLSDAPLRAYNVTIKPYKETYAERIDALKGLFLSPDAAQRSLQQRDSLKLNDFLPQNIPPWDQERHRESFGKLADQIQDLTTRHDALPDLAKRFMLRNAYASPSKDTIGQRAQLVVLLTTRPTRSF
jgi:hypothetical protein